MNRDEYFHCNSHLNGDLLGRNINLSPSKNNEVWKGDLGEKQNIEVRGT